MKHLLTVGLVFFSLIAFAQEKEEEKDTTRLNFGETEVLIINKKGKPIQVGNPELRDTIDAAPDKNDDDDVHDGHWGGMDFGYNVFLNSSGGTSLTSDTYLDNILPSSSYFSMNIFEHRFQIYKHYIGITTGLGSSFQSFSIKNNQLVYSNKDSVWLIQDTINKYKENRLTASYINIPLLLEFNSKENNDKSYHLQLGVIGGYNVGNQVFRKIKREDFKSKERVRGVYGFNDFRCDATVRFGYGNYGLFVNYALLPMFNKKQFEEVYPLTFGLSLNF